MNLPVSKGRRSLGMSLLLLISLYSASYTEGAIGKAKGDVLEVTGVQNQDIHIPCEGYSKSSGESALLILWYKDSYPTPIYSFDARTRNDRHWVDDMVLGDRAQFISDVEEPYLRILRIQPLDEGVYTCRVDYRRQPTLRGKTKLSVIIPPGVPTILDDKGEKVGDTDVIGPYNEGTYLNVTCQVIGGKPAPQVIWWRREELLDNTVDERNNTTLLNTLRIGPLTREHLDAFYVCQATNTDKVLPVSKGVTLDVNFKPLSVEILGDREPLITDMERNVMCQSIGARPPANITWWLDGTDITSQFYTESEIQGNVSMSLLSFVPKEEDAGKLLTCKAQSPVMEHQPLEDSWKLEIFYTPKVDIELDTDVNPEDIREGDNVTLYCNVRANPQASNISWHHKGVMLQHNATAGIKIRKQSLTLKDIERHQSGLYSCVASNLVGDGQSGPVVLDIKYAPVCSDPDDQIVGAAKADDIEMVCRVDASPGDVTFKWFMRSPQELIAIHEENYTIQDRTSRLAYHIRTEYDYGEFLCYAENDLGGQSKPCSFNVVPAGKPDSLKNCTLTNQTTDTLFITCLPGFNGGLDQHFVVVVQAYDDEIRGEILRNATETEEPVFVIEGLQPGASYLLAIYAENDKGRSEDSVLHGFTLPTPPGERITLPSTHIFPITPILGVLIGVVGALVIVAIVVVVVMKLRSDARSAKGSPKGPSEVNLKGPRAPLQPAKDNDDGPDVILYPQYEEVDGIPSKLKHANIYETVKCDSKENSKNSENDDRDDVEYAELTFTNGKSKKKKSGVNGTIRPSEENTIYASIDHTRTAQQNAQAKQNNKQQPQQPQQQKQPTQQQSKPQDLHQPYKGKQQGIDHLDTAAQGETDDIPLMDSALESSV